MDTPLLIWGCTVCTIILTATIKLAVNTRRFVKRNKQPFIQMGCEREEFFIPGDPLLTEDMEDED